MSSHECFSEATCMLASAANFWHLARRGSLPQVQNLCPSDLIPPTNHSSTLANPSLLLHPPYRFTIIIHPIDYISVWFIMSTKECEISSLNESSTDGAADKTDSLRIVSLLPSITEVLSSLGVANQLVGITHECDYPKEALEGAQVVTVSDISPHTMTQAQIHESVCGSLVNGHSLYGINKQVLRGCA